MSIDAMKQALEALERYSGVDQRACDAEDALRIAIEQAERVKRAEEAFAAASEEMKSRQPMVVSQECAERGCMAHDDRVDGPGVVIERQPLTEEEIDQGLLRTSYALQSAAAWRDGVRFAERAHGIGGEE